MAPPAVKDLGNTVHYVPRKDGELNIDLHSNLPFDKGEKSHVALLIK
jgi:hypothetical protein